MPGLYLGIDGGQSATTALIADSSGRVLGEGHGGPCNHITGPEARAKFLRAVGDCIRQATEESSLDAETVDFAAACCGFSGGAEDKEAFARELIRSKQYKITHDAEIALAGATAGKPGIVVIAGTGSIAFGRNQKDETARAGGWGYIFGDEGGAFDLVRRALRAALRQEEGWGPKTQLRQLLLSETQEKSANALLHKFYATPRSDIARLARLIDAAAKAEDHLATEILEEAAAALASYAHGVYRQLFSSGDRSPVAFIGGVFQSEILRCGFSQQVSKFGAEAIRPKFGPAAGALIEALRLDGFRPELSDVPVSEKSAIRRG